jgi:hypothetical protein
MSKLATAALAVCTILGLGLGVALAQGDDKMPERPKPTAEHKVLNNFVGEWDCEMESYAEPGKGVKHKGTMTGKMLGDFWAICTIKGDMGGMTFTGQGTFGYDSKKKKAVGHWIDSMGEFLWTYDGKIEGKKLVLDAMGPSMSDPSKLIAYRDTWDFSTPDTLILTSEFTGPEGKLTPMMKATCTKKK